MNAQSTPAGGRNNDKVTEGYIAYIDEFPLQKISVATWPKRGIYWVVRYMSQCLHKMPTCVNMIVRRVDAQENTKLCMIQPVTLMIEDAEPHGTITI